MKKIAIIAAGAAFALSACGETTDASDDAVADTVEVPADDAMDDVPEPVADEEMMTDEEADAEMDMNEDMAEQAGDDAMSVVEAAEAAEAEMEAAE
ncbi:lipoprotein [Aurantiacibacter sp. MUD61]|uniref:lipoprotein n=1 Tax=Aurantiacibacter sp. MUD61 TaxID=3009083 RepID=UPI0022F09651|nr:lipoprotein [Aurantiacibacter sp. MUD61]